MKAMDRRLRAAREMKRLTEAYPTVGADSSEDFGWRSLTQMTQRDLTPLVQKRMQDIAVYLYDSNPMAHRILELTKDFIVGDGFRFVAKDPKVQEVLEKHWYDRDNQWKRKQETKALELGLWGEQCYPVYVNKHTGHVKIGYLDPGLITKVRPDLNNPEISKTVEWAKKMKTVKWQVINEDKRVSSKTRGSLVGDCFYFAINKVAWSTRGRSDLLPLADWIDGHDQFLFARLERAFYLNTFIWDVLCEGMSKKQIVEFAKNIQTPKPGSVRVHNQKVKWDVISPKLESADASAEAKLFKAQILGGIGYPTHWFSEGEQTTRACYSEDTETLTEKGWKKYWEIKKGEKLATFNPKKDRIEFYKPKGNIYLYDYEGEMYHFTNMRTDILVTPEHRMWVKEAHKGRKFEIIQAKDITYKTFYIKEGVKNWIGKKQEYFELPYVVYDMQSRIKDIPKKIKMIDWLEFLGWFLSEGVLNKAKNQYSIRIAQKKSDNVEKIRKLFTKLGYIFHEVTNKRSGVITFSFNNKSVWHYLKESVGSLSKEKRIPKELLQLDKFYLQILFNSMMLGDGHWDKRKGRNCFSYSTNSKQLADDFQILCLLLGYSSRQSISKKGIFQWNTITGSRIIERDLRNRVCINNRKKRYESHIQKENYKGKVYCFSMPYQFMITRRNGKIAIQLQTAQEMALPTLKGLRSRQKTFKNIIEDVFDFVIDQAIIHGVLDEKVDRRYTVLACPIITKEARGLALTLEKFAQAMKIAIDSKWITNESAKTAFQTFMTDLGIELKELEKLQESTIVYRNAKGG